MKDNHYFLAMNNTEKNFGMKSGEEEILSKKSEEEFSVGDEKESYKGENGGVEDKDDAKYDEINKRFKTAKVRAWVSLNEVYDKEEICCMSFYEVVEVDEVVKQGFRVEEVMEGDFVRKKTMVIFYLFNFCRL